MSHWAELNENNIVLRVLVGDNNDPAGDEGESFIKNTFGGTWLKTSYNGNIRKNFAASGYHYDDSADVFYAPQPFASWKLDRRSFTWKPPIPVPTDDKQYLWDETNQTWKEIA